MSSRDGEEEQLLVRIPASLKDLVDADSRTNKEIVKTALWREFGGERKSFLETKKEHKLTQAAQLESEGEDILDEAEQLREEAERLEAKIEDLEEDTSYEDDLGDLLAEFANSRAVLPRFRSDAKEIAEEHGKPLSQIEEDLRDLAAEQDLDIAAERWTDDYGEGLQ